MVINTLKEDNAKLIEALERNNAHRKEHIAIQKLREENKILLLDLDTIRDPNKRAFIAAEQARIMQKRSAQHQPPPPPPSASNDFNNYFDNIGGSKTDLSDY